MTAVGCEHRHFTRLRIYSKDPQLVTGFNANTYYLTEESRLWSNQTDISYSFLDNVAEGIEESYHLHRKRAILTTAMKEYAKYANIKFVPAEDPASANIRISFHPGSHWSAIGTDALMFEKGSPTMNLALIDPGMVLTDRTASPTSSSSAVPTRTADAVNYSIALHAIGHALGLWHETQEPPSSNFGNFDVNSIMKDFKYSKQDLNVACDINLQLSDHDKGWLTLNYPKVVVNKHTALDNDTWTLHRSLQVLAVSGKYPLRILETDDVSERRFFYSQFVMSRQDEARKVIDRVPSSTVPSEAMSTATEDALLKLQTHMRPKAVPGRLLHGATPRPTEIEQSVLDLFRHLSVESSSSALAETAGSNSGRHGGKFGTTPSLLQHADPSGFRDYAERPTEQPPEDLLTQDELDDLLDQLPDVPNHDPNDDLPDANVQHVVLSLLPRVEKIVRLLGRLFLKGNIDVTSLPGNVTEIIRRTLQDSLPQDVFQEVYTLCFASYLVHQAKGTQIRLQEALQTFLQKSVLPAISKPEAKWELVWGPVVWKKNPDDKAGGPDLAWYIAFNPCLAFEDYTTHPTYVIAIAGTPMSSVYTWFKSNLDVLDVIYFESWVSGGIQKEPSKDIVSGRSYIARGTARTVWRLLTQQAPDGAASAQKSLLDFLRELDKTGSPRFITTGHSLGGALSPTLALALVEQGIIKAEDMLTYPIAGASPGNDEFAERFSKTFPAKRASTKESYKVWNLNIVNRYDPVPQAWCAAQSWCKEQNLWNIAKMYSECPSLTPLIYSVVYDLSSAMLKYHPLQSQIFSASSNVRKGGLNPKDALYHHIQAYHDQVGINPPTLRELKSEKDHR